LEDIEFVITTDRIIVRPRDLGQNKASRFPSNAVMNISYRQALWERILGTGISLLNPRATTGINRLAM